jgi:hypothetical protein
MHPKDMRHIKQQNEGARLHTLVVVGERGFEPPTSASRTLRANRAALLPERARLYHRPQPRAASRQGRTEGQANSNGVSAETASSLLSRVSTLD